MELILKIGEYNLELIKRFAYWLIPEMYPLFIAKISGINFTKWDEYMNTLNINWKNDPFILSTEDILISSWNNLIVTTQNNDVVIKIDGNKQLLGTYETIASFARLVEYGNLQISGIKIFDDVFQKVADDIRQYYNKFMAEDL